MQLIANNAFIHEIQIEKVPGDDIPGVRATWKLAFPSCFTDLCVTFRDKRDNSVIVRRCIQGSEAISSTNKMVERGFMCNTNVRVELQVSDVISTITSRSNGAIYTGGMALYITMM